MCATVAWFLQVYWGSELSSLCPHECSRILPTEPSLFLLFLFFFMPTSFSNGALFFLGKFCDCGNFWAREFKQPLIKALVRSLDSWPNPQTNHWSDEIRLGAYLLGALITYCCEKNISAWQKQFKEEVLIFCFCFFMSQWKSKIHNSKDLTGAGASSSWWH